MEFGIFHEFWSTRARSQEEAFADSFAEIAAAEEWGLDADRKSKPCQSNCARSSPRP